MIDPISSTSIQFIFQSFSSRNPPSQKPVEDDVDAVEEGLPLRLRVFGVQHLYRFFDHAPMVFSDQHDELVGVAHPTHGDIQPIGHGLVEHPQAVVGVSQAELATTPAQPRGGPQHNPLQKRRPASLAPGESRSDHNVDVTRAQPVDHRGQVLDAVLAVGVERGENLRPGLVAGVLDAGLDSGALAQIDRVAHQVSSGSRGDFPGAVGAAVVYADDMVEGRAHIGYDLADDGRFVEGGNDDPDVGAVGFSAHLSPQGTRWPGRDQRVERPSRASATTWTPIPTSGPHNRATTVRVSSGSGSSSNSPDATVAATQPSEYARCRAAATAAAPVSVSMAIANAAPVSHASSAPPARYCGPNATRSNHGPITLAASTPTAPMPPMIPAGAMSARSRWVRSSTK